MNPPDLSRLHALRMRNDATGFAMDEMRPRFDSLRDRHVNGTAPRAVSAFQLFQTPEPLAERMVDLAEPSPGLSWLEPSAGLGRLVAPILKTGGLPVLCESDANLAGELFNAFPDAPLWQCDFLSKTPAPVFDRVAMNPPFHLRADIAHVLHAIGYLKPGGVLVGLCLDTHHRETALRHLSDVWEKIPAGTFRKEGTNVATVLFRIRNV